MSKDTETSRHDAEVAQFRFALIAPVVQGLYPDASATAYYKRVTEKTNYPAGRLHRHLQL